MRGDQRVVDFLNDHLTLELSIINQYFLTAKLAENWGLHGIAKFFRELSLEEMRDAEGVMDRVLYLGGLPNLQKLGSVPVGETVPEQLQLALRGELEICEHLREGIELCTQVGDQGTREVLTRMLLEEEGHVDLFESHLDAIARVGEQNYLAQHLHA